ncbi:hypothetical protein [Bartonella gliris]|uniref:hypothetical protein n=1 Tax=Bartonella gliris TaxID=3004109 RepID=UPI00295E6DAC|nr:hypothetical protein [Bartonella gliris]
MSLYNKRVHVQQNGLLFFVKSVIHETRKKQKRVAMRNLHSLKDIAMETFESRKTELKENSAAARGLDVNLQATAKAQAL